MTGVLPDRPALQWVAFAAYRIQLAVCDRLCLIICESTDRPHPREDSGENLTGESPT
jgi:hypothetical protein